jgi:hypothetical protein
MREALVHTGRT